MLIQNLEEFQNFAKLGFPGIPVKIYKIWGKFMDFQSYSLSISYRISNVVHGGVWIFSGIPLSVTRDSLNRILQISLQDAQSIEIDCIQSLSDL